MRKESITVLFLILMFFVSGCGRAEIGSSDASGQPFRQLSEQAETFLLENADSSLRAVIEIYGVEVTRLYFGKLKSDGAEEALLVCKIPDLPHVGGLDRTIIICCDIQDEKMYSLLDLPFDEVEIAKTETSEGIMRLLVIGTALSQGYASQWTGLYSVESGEWVLLQGWNAQSDVEEEIFYHLMGENLVGTAEYRLYEESVILEVLSWNPETGLFE